MIRVTVGLIASFLIIFVLFSLLGLAALALALAFGWVLHRFLPFTWFETTLLSMLAILPIFFALLNKPISPEGEEEMEEDEEDEWYEEDEEPVIPLTRFWKKGTTPSGEALLRFLFANEIYDMLITGPPAERWTDEELQEVASELADSAVAILRKMPPRKSPHIGKAKLRTALQKQSRWPEYEPFLTDFVYIVNSTVALWEPLVRHIQEDHLWNKTVSLADFFDVNTP